MARVHHRKARKDYPDHGIKKGDMYYFSQIKTGPRSSRTLRSLTPFKRSQLTTSEFFARQYDLEDQLAEISHLEGDVANTGVEDQAQEVADEIRALGDEQEEKIQNMPDALQYSPTGELLQERYDGCTEWADEIEQALQEVPEEVEHPEDEPEEPEAAEFAEGEEDDDYVSAKDEYDTAYAAWEESKDAYDTYLEELESAVDTIKECCLNC